jgi:hypothetical protein
VLIEFLQDKQFIWYEFIVLNRYLIDVDQYLFNRDISLAAQPQLNLHPFYQNLIHLLILSMELPFLVVYTIQKILYVWNFRKIRWEKFEKSIVEFITLTKLLIYWLDFFQQWPFLMFLVIENSFENLLISSP